MRNNTGFLCYMTPVVRRVVQLEPQSTLLSGSVVDTMSVHTMGHEVQNYTIDGSGEYTFETPSWGGFDWGD